METPDIKVIEIGSMMIPLCCKEGWESCIHTVKRQKPKKTNIGL